MKKTFFLLSSLAVVLFFVTSCEDDHEHEDGNVVTITIEEPIDGEVIATADCGTVHIHADIAATIELHEVKVELHPEDNSSDMIIDFEEHTHDQTYTFEQEVNLCSYDSGTAFHLHVEAYVNHDGTETVTKEVEFSIE